MAEERVYLDTSALVKRYVNEKGTDEIDKVFKGAREKSATIYLSFWNVAEAMGIFDKYSRTSKMDRNKTIGKFLGELKALKEIGSFNTLDVRQSLISEAIEYVLKYHIYIADALQISSCKSAQCNKFLTSDKRLAESAKAEGIETILL